MAATSPIAGAFWMQSSIQRSMSTAQLVIKIPTATSAKLHWYKSARNGVDALSRHLRMRIFRKGTSVVVSIMLTAELRSTTDQECNSNEGNGVNSSRVIIYITFVILSSKYHLSTSILIYNGNQNVYIKCVYVWYLGCLLKLNTHMDLCGKTRQHGVHSKLLPGSWDPWEAQCQSCYCNWKSWLPKKVLS